jgi:hypothetical protein
MVLAVRVLGRLGRRLQRGLGRLLLVAAVALAGGLLGRESAGWDGPLPRVAPAASGLVEGEPGMARQAIRALLLAEPAEPEAAARALYAAQTAEVRARVDAQGGVAGLARSLAGMAGRVREPRHVATNRLPDGHALVYYVAERADGGGYVSYVVHLAPSGLVELVE